MKNVRRVLVRSNGDRPMWSVLNRYNIGHHDKYDRGLWIDPFMLSDIKEHMLNDKSIIEHLLPDQIMVNGSNQHNQVDFLQFVALLYNLDYNGGAETITVLKNIARTLS